MHLAALSSTDMPPFLWGALLLAIILLLWDTIEVGRNDGANLVNAIFGARVLKRRPAVLLAGAGVLLGAAASSPVIETARKGIFNPEAVAKTAQDDTPKNAGDASSPEGHPASPPPSADPITKGLEKVLAIYVSVYIVDTVLLYGYSAFGMPVSTTASLVFELLGAAFAVGGVSVVHWPTAGKVVFAIICSIIVTGIAGFLIHRAVRGAIRDRTQDLRTLQLHGGWVGGGMLAGLFYFMIIKGMKNVGFVKTFNAEVLQAYGSAMVVFGLWFFFSLIIYAWLSIGQERAAKWLFPSLAILGTFCMGFAFGQNDLANCASPGLAAFNLIQNREQGVALATKIPIPAYGLWGCGLLLVMGMATKNAQRVTSAAVNTGSMANTVELWAPVWCVKLARVLLRFRGTSPSIAPPPAQTPAGKSMHYDVLRACVILSVSACVIATASGLGLPVSTTYVTFAAVVATGMADRIYQRGDAALKLGRTVWVVFSWFSAAVIAAIAAGLTCLAVYNLGTMGMALSLLANLIIRQILKTRGDAQEKRTRQEAEERLNPELFTEGYD